MKKYGIFAVLAMAVLAVVLVVGCIAPIDTSNFKFPGSQGSGTPVAGDPTPGDPAPAGMGSIQVSLGSNANARAVFSPTEPTLAAFAHYELVFTKVASDTDSETATVHITTGTSGPVTAIDLPAITLKTGTYEKVDVTVYAAGDTAGTAGNSSTGTAGARPTPQRPIASGTTGTLTGANIITIVASPSPAATAPTIDLKPYVTGTGNTAAVESTGTFSFNATHPVTNGSISAAAVTIAGIPGLTSGTAPAGAALAITLADATWALTNVTIPSGYYFVDLAITAAPSVGYVGFSGQKVYRNILQVNQNMATAMTGLTYNIDDLFGFEVDSTYVTGTAGGQLAYEHNPLNEFALEFDSTTGPATVVPGGGGSQTNPVVMSAGTLIVRIDTTAVGTPAIPNGATLDWYIGAIGTTPIHTDAYDPGDLTTLELSIDYDSAPFLKSAASYEVTLIVHNGGSPVGANGEPFYIKILP